MANPKIAHMADVPKAHHLLYSRKRPLRFEGETAQARQDKAWAARLKPVPDGLVILTTAFAGDELRPEAWTQVQAHLLGAGVVRR